MTQMLGFHRLFEPCWCPAALHGYSVAEGQSALPDAAAEPFAVPVVEATASFQGEMYGLSGVWTVYRLSLALGEGASSLYTIYGALGEQMVIPPAFQATAPFGVDIGGTDPQSWGQQADSRYDSWLSVGPVDNEAQSYISSVGIDFSMWSESQELTSDRGAVFWVDVGLAPPSDSAVVAQLTVRQGTIFEARLSAGGRGPSGTGDDDWRQTQIIFTNREETPAVLPEQATDEALRRDCEYFSAIFTTTMVVPRDEAGRYTFFEASHLSATVFVDGAQLSRLGCVYRDGQCAENMYSAALQEGEHTVVVRFVEGTGGAYSHLWWQFVGSDCHYTIGNYTEPQWLGPGAAQPLDLTDDGYAEVSLPFDFPFFGGTKRSMRVSSNGYVSFSGSHSSYGDTAPIPSEDVPNDMIAVYWTDLNPEGCVGCGVYARQEGADEYVVLWSQVPLFGAPSVATFELIMHRDGGVRLLYEDVPPQIVEHAPPSIGLENADGTQGLRISWAEVMFPEDGVEVAIPYSCEHPAIEGGVSAGARACAPQAWSVELYDGDDYSSLLSATCVDAASTSVSRATEDGFLAADALCPTSTCPSSWQGDGECDEGTEYGARICPPGSDAEDCGTEARGCWCPRELQHYDRQDTTADAVPDWVPGAANGAGSCGTFGAIYMTTLTVQTAGLYRFTEASPDELAVFVDGEHLHRSGCVLESKGTSNLESMDYTMECTEASAFEVELSAASHVIVVEVLHRGEVATTPPTLEWEYLGTAPCEWSAAPFSWVDASSLGTEITDVPQLGGVTRPLPSSWGGFPFFGGAKSSINVFADGLLSFGSPEGAADGATQALPSTAEPNDLIAPFWADLDLSAAGAQGGIYQYTAPDESFWAVEWHEVPYFGSGLRLSFQAQLRRNGSMAFSYKSTPAAPPSHSWGRPSIGLENFAGTDGLRIAYDPDAASSLSPGTNGYPAPLSTVSVPSACATAECGPLHWVIAAYADLAFEQ